MDLVKQYINQSITIAANNLRLNNQQIEVVALLKEAIIKSENLSDDLINMKKITELSLLAIRLNEIYNYLTQNTIDLLKISDQFKEHSRQLIKDLDHMLDVSTPSSFKSAIDKLKSGFTTSKEEIKVEADGWTISMRDGKISALYEDTVAITAKGPKVLT